MVMGLLTVPAFSALAQSGESDVYDCLREAETFEEMNQCSDRHIEYWRDRMAVNLRQLSSLLPETRRIMLDDTQDAWNEYRVRQTDLSNAIHYSSEDMMHRIFAKIREARLYQQRSEFLEDLIEVEQS